MPETKKRHGCLTAYLALIIVANCATLLLYLFAGEAAKRLVPNTPAWAHSASLLFCITNVVGAMALFKWKKWGFWCLLIPTLLMTAVNLSLGHPLGPSVGGLVGVAILYGALHMGRANKEWRRLS